MRSHTIPAGADGMALNKYMRRAYPMCSADMLRNALKRRDFKLDGRRIGANDRLSAGARLECYIADKYLTPDGLSELYRDDGLAIIIKPQGISCQRDAQGIGEDTVESRIADMYGARARLVNRLDHNTGGVMPIALSDDVYTELLAAFHDHTVEKTYVCIAIGVPPKAHDRLINYAVRTNAPQLWRLYDAPIDGGVRMAMAYEIAETLEDGAMSRLRIKLETGRTHQIRAQLSHIGCPILGDDTYGDRAQNALRRAAVQRLWCESIAFTSGTYKGRRFEAKAAF